MSPQIGASGAVGELRCWLRRIFGHQVVSSRGWALSAAPQAALPTKARPDRVGRREWRRVQVRSVALYETPASHMQRTVGRRAFHVNAMEQLWKACCMAQGVTGVAWFARRCNSLARLIDAACTDLLPGR